MYLSEFNNVCVCLISPGLPCQNEINRIHTQSRRKSLIGRSVIKPEIDFIQNNEQVLISIIHKKQPTVAVCVCVCVCACTCACVCVCAHACFAAEASQKRGYN